MQFEHQLLNDMYAAFNARDIDSCLAGMHADVIWANGIDGGYVYGHQGVREYWTRQWKLVDPKVEPTGFRSHADKIIIDVHQVVHAIDGTLLLDRMVSHIFTLKDGLIRQFDIGEETSMP